MIQKNNLILQIYSMSIRQFEVSQFVPPRPSDSGCIINCSSSMWCKQHFCELIVENYYLLFPHWKISDEITLFTDALLFKHMLWKAFFYWTAVCVCLIFFFIECIVWCTNLMVLLVCWYTVVSWESKTQEWFGLEDLILQSTLFGFNITVHPFRFKV